MPSTIRAKETYYKGKRDLLYLLNLQCLHDSTNVLLMLRCVALFTTSKNLPQWRLAWFRGCRNAIFSSLPQLKSTPISLWFAPTHPPSLARSHTHTHTTKHTNTHMQVNLVKRNDSDMNLQQLGQDSSPPSRPFASGMPATVGQLGLLAAC